MIEKLVSGSNRTIASTSQSGGQFMPKGWRIRIGSKWFCNQTTSIIKVSVFFVYEYGKGAGGAGGT